MYWIELDDAAERDLSKLSSKVKRQIAKLVDTLAIDPYSGNVREFVGYKSIYRKCTGDYRVVCTVQDEQLIVLVLIVGPRKDVYETMKRRIEWFAV